MTVQDSTFATLADELKAHTGRFTDKQFDWNAFPSNAGFDELARAQMRYIGAGGSPKVGDTSTLKPDNFTVSLIYKETGKYAACHSHEIEESFLIINGALIVGWASRCRRSTTTTPRNTRPSWPVPLAPSPARPSSSTPRANITCSS